MRKVASLCFGLILLFCFGPGAHAQSILGLNPDQSSLNGQFFLAVEVAEKSLDAAEKDLGPDHPSVAASLNRLAALYVRQGKYSQAVTLYNRSLAIYKKALGTDATALAALDGKPLLEQKVVLARR